MLSIRVTLVSECDTFTYGETALKRSEASSLMCLKKSVLELGPPPETRPPGDCNELYSIQYKKFSLLRGLSGVCLNYFDRNSQSENVHSFERSRKSDFCIIL